MPSHDIPLKPYGPTAGRDHLTGERPRPKTLTVDLHNHYRVPKSEELVVPRLDRGFHPANAIASPLTREVNKRQHADRDIEFTDINKRIADMEKMQLDVMAVSCSPTQCYYTAEPSLGAESSQIINDAIFDAVKQHPRKLTGLGTVPLQNTDLALKELERLTGELGFRGIQFSPEWAMKNSQQNVWSRSGSIVKSSTS